MESYIFWDKIVELHEDFEYDGVDKYIILDMSGGMELILSISSIDLLDSEKVIVGLMDDGTEVIISIDEVCCLRHNPSWISVESIKKESVKE